MRMIMILVTMILGTWAIYGEDEQVLRVGLVYDGISIGNAEAGKMFIKEAEKIVGKGKVVVTVEEADNWTIEGIGNIIKAMDKKADVDVIITIGVIGSGIADKMEKREKYFIAPFYYGDKDRNDKDEKISSFYSEKEVEKEIELFMELSKVKKVAVVVSDLSRKMFGEKLKKLEEIKNIRIIDAEEPVSNTIEKLTSGEGVYLALLKELDEAVIKEFSNRLLEKGIASFSLMGSCDTEKGILAGYSYKNEIEKRARKSAIVLQKIYDNEKISRYEEIKIGEEKLVINMESAHKLGITPSWKMIEAGEPIYVDRTIKKVTLKSILENGLKKNSEMKIKDKEIEIQKNETLKANSKYMPVFTTELTGVMIDKKTADASLGSYKEKTIKGEIKATQIIYSEDANLNSDIQKKNTEIKEIEKEQKKADIIAATSVTYLQMLKADAAVRINRENLENNIKNLNRAKNKEKNGAINSADVYRWESETALSKTALARAEGILKQIKNSLVRKMCLDLSDEFTAGDSEEISDYIGGNVWKIAEMVENRGQGNTISEFFIKKAFQNSIELKMVDKEIEMRKRYVEFTERKKYMPTIAIQAGYSYKPYADGGSDGMDLSGLKAIGLDIPKTEKPPKDNWNIGIGVTFDIFTGGEREAESKKAKNETENSSLRKENIMEEIRENILSEYSNLETEYYNLKNMSDALKALKSNYDLVDNGYKSGQIDIAAFLSSKNAMVSAEQGTVVAKYDFMISLIKIERMSGVLLFMDTEKQRKWENELQELIKGGN